MICFPSNIDFSGEFHFQFLYANVLKEKLISSIKANEYSFQH